ncbi:MAG: glycosyltransferase [Melioribacteraceae bacterium]|nr:glycosyltransferase [Melioribacteraceae bacterium]
MKLNEKDLWIFRQSKSPGISDRIILGILIAAGLISVFRLAEWWFRESHVSNLLLFVLLSGIFWYGIIRLILSWINYLGINKPNRKGPPSGYSVAIFTTSSPGEPLSMFEKTLEACANIKYPHTTYLLDDTRNPVFRTVAEKYGAVWLELVGLPGAKAGKINKALSLTDEDFILVLDPDHIPFPNFLDEVLGFFEDENVGYVQVSQAYYNQYRSFTAKGAAEQTYTFYGPTQMGLSNFNCSVAIGANCTFRRKALESIGGHGIGLAEDLVTAVRIHSEGWKSVYHPVIVSRGLVPEDFGSFCKQQMKWARGVHEILFSEIPRLFKKLSFWQCISYLTIGTYYAGGLTTFIYLLVPFIYLWFGIVPAKMYFIEFLSYGFPVLFFSFSIYLFVQKYMCHPEVERGFHWRGMILKFACWPVFLLGLFLSLIDKNVPYIPTAKQAVVGKITPFAWPLIIHIVIFILTISFTIYERRFELSDVELISTAERVYSMISFALIPFVLAIMVIYALLESRKLKSEDPWSKVDIKQLCEKNRKV